MSSDSSPNLALPFLTLSQAQKHVTHNEALGLLDLLVQLTVRDFGATTPPVLPEEGEVWALGAAPLGEWAGQAGLLAAWSGRAWVFVEPRPGWRAAGLADGSLRVWSGTGWERPGLDNLDGLGIGTAHDATNRLAVSSLATLLTHAGSDHRLLLNKAAVIDTASLLFQSGWSGRAEMGLAGDDDFVVKVSADGSTWTEALRVTAATGAVTILNGAQINGTLMGMAVTQTNADTTAGRLLKVGDAGILGVPVTAPEDFGVTNNSIGRGVWYRAGTGAVGVPANIVGNGQSYVFHHRRVDAGEVQMLLNEFAANEVDRTIWYRRRTAGPWGAWKRMYDTANILGTVSQSGGVPTGAVIERGSNANGQFVRFADGTQICCHTQTTNVALDFTSPGSGFRNETPISWTFPAGFISSPVLQITVANAGTGTISSLSASSANYFFGSVASQTATVRTAYLIVFGRWF